MFAVRWLLQSHFPGHDMDDKAMVTFVGEYRIGAAAKDEIWDFKPVGLFYERFQVFGLFKPVIQICRPTDADGSEIREGAGGFGAGELFNKLLQRLLIIFIHGLMIKEFCVELNTLWRTNRS